MSNTPITRVVLKRHQFVTALIRAVTTPDSVLYRGLTPYEFSDLSITIYSDEDHCQRIQDFNLGNSDAVAVGVITGPWRAIRKVLNNVANLNGCNWNTLVGVNVIQKSYDKSTIILSGHALGGKRKQ